MSEAKVWNIGNETQEEQEYEEDNGKEEVSYKQL